MKLQKLGLNWAKKAALIVSVAGLSATAVADTLLIKNATVDTMTSKGQLQGADVLIENGKVKQIADNLTANADRVIDGTGKRLTPGIFNMYTQIGLVEVGAIEQTRDFAVESDTFSASLSVVDAFNGHSTVIPQNRIHGLTTALIVPESADHLFAGKASVVDMSGSLTESVVKRDVAVVVNYNERAQHMAGGSRAAALATLKNALNDAKEFSRNKSKYLGGNGRELSMSFDDLEALIPVINKQQYLMVKVNRAADILQILKLKREFNINMILHGVQEGWMVADDIAKAKTPVIIEPVYNLPEQFETLGARLENAALMNEAGVQLLITGYGWQNTHNAYLVTQSAGNAVTHGLPYQSALEAITLNPAKVFGVERGTIEVGKVADLVLWSGDPLEVAREAEFVMVDGESVPMVSRATRLRDRYLDKINAYLDSKEAK